MVARSWPELMPQEAAVAESTRGSSHAPLAGHELASSSSSSSRSRDMLLDSGIDRPPGVGSRYLIGGCWLVSVSVGGTPRLPDCA